jgi:hypothetical protein
MIGSLFIPGALFSNNNFNNTSLSNVLVWMFSPVVIEIMLVLSLAVTTFLVVTEKP